MTRMPLGGIRTPSVPAAATQPAAILWLYLCRSISGMATCATVAAVATLEPDTAAKHALANTVEVGSPPGIEPNHVRAASKALDATPAANAIYPMNRNSGSTM